MTSADWAKVGEVASHAFGLLFLAVLVCGLVPSLRQFVVTLGVLSLFVLLFYFYVGARSMARD